MLKKAGRHMQECEKILASALTGFAAELRMIDAVDLVADIRHERHNHLEDLINSSAELFFKQDTLRFSHDGEVDLKWDQPATVILSMEFSHMQVRAHFKLLIEAEQAGVQLEYLTDGSQDLEESDPEALLARALADARLYLPPQAFARYQISALAAESGC
ncbi:MAG: hypothetical protein ACR2OM_13195 [Aestuariivirgaceae bacterium]